MTRHATATTPSRHRVPMAVLVGVAVAVVAATGCTISRVNTSRTLADEAHPFQALPAQPPFRLLVAGDSTAVGVGASAPERSLAGLIGQQHPGWEIRNVARSGARLVDVAEQLAAADGGFDAVLILAGGNDVIQLTRRDALRAQFEEVLDLAQRRGHHVVLMPCGDVGHAPFFLPPLSWWMSQRSQALHAEASAAAGAAGATYVRLLRPRDQDPFVAEATRMHAQDGLHPSDDGYRQWYRTLLQQSGLPLQQGTGEPPRRPANRGSAAREAVMTPALQRPA